MACGRRSKGSGCIFAHADGARRSATTERDGALSAPQSGSRTSRRWHWQGDRNGSSSKKRERLRRQQLLQMQGLTEMAVIAAMGQVPVMEMEMGRMPVGQMPVVEMEVGRLTPFQRVTLPRVTHAP